MAGRRERLREELLASVRDAARANLQQDGPAGLSLRAVARDVGISPAGLYRYYDGRDALLTMLITDGYDDLADHLYLAQGAAEHRSDSTRSRVVPHAVDADADVALRVRATWRTYRSWALAHPNEFHLLFGQPIEGYEAPAGGDTVVANERMAQALAMPLLEAHGQGRLRLPRLAEETPAIQRLAEAIQALAPVPITPAFAALTVSAWSCLHGAVALELNGQFHWLDDTGGDELFEASMARAMADLGVDAEGGGPAADGPAADGPAADGDGSDVE